MGDEAVAGGAHAADDDHVLRAAEGAVLLPVLDDARGECRADPGQALELRGRGGVEVDAVRGEEQEQARENLRSAELGVDVARKTSVPALSANLGLGARGSSIVPNNRFASLGASVQWNPFDSGLTAGRTREARASPEAAKADLRTTEIVVTSDVSQAYLNLRTAGQRVVTAESEVTNAQESVRLAEGRYRAGIGTFIEVIDAQTALVTANTNRVNALSAVDQARAALSRAIAAPLPTGP